MADFESGVSGYIVGTATIRISFPVDWRGNAHVCCDQCDIFSRTSGRCPITHMISEFPERYIGSRCPLNFETNEEEVHEGT